MKQTKLEREIPKRRSNKIKCRKKYKKKTTMTGVRRKNVINGVYTATTKRKCQSFET